MHNLPSGNSNARPLECSRIRMLDRSIPHPRSPAPQADKARLVPTEHRSPIPDFPSPILAPPRRRRTRHALSLQSTDPPSPILDPPSSIPVQKNAWLLVLSAKHFRLVHHCAWGRALFELCVAVGGVVAELLLDAEQLVVLGHAVGAAQRTGLDLSAVGGNCDVGDCGVLGLTAAV